MSFSQPTVSLIGKNLSRKRNFTKFRNSQEISYITDIEVKGPVKGRKINDKDLSRKPQTDPKQAGVKSGNSQDIIFE